MDTKIIPKKSVLSGAVPPTGSLGLGEIAINHADKKLYAKHPSTGAIQEIGSLSAHSHDELYSLNGTQHLELQNNGSLVLNGSTTLTLPSASGTIATLADITGSVAGVTSVNTRTGAVTLAKSDVALDNVDNTSDASKPISTATQTALNAKVGSVTTGIANSTPITNMMQITQGGYNAITPVANTLYIIVG
jgi:hypothetical protein